MTERAQLSGVSLCAAHRPDGSICGLPASIVGPAGMVCPAHAPKPAAVLSREQIAQWRAEHMLAAHAREIADSHEVLREALAEYCVCILNGLAPRTGYDCATYPCKAGRTLAPAPGSSAGVNDSPTTEVP